MTLALKQGAPRGASSLVAESATGEMVPTILRTQPWAHGGNDMG